MYLSILAKKLIESLDTGLVLLMVSSLDNGFVLYYKARRFGKSSEKHPDQGELFDEA